MPTRRQIRGEFVDALSGLGVTVHEHRPRPEQRKEFINITANDEEPSSSRGLDRKDRVRAVEIEIEVYADSIDRSDLLSDSVEDALLDPITTAHTIDYLGSQFDSEYLAETKQYLRTIRFNVQYCR